AQLFQAFFFVNVANIPELVRTGRLDSLLVLPIDSQFAVSSKQFGLDSVVNAALGGAVVIVSLTRLGVAPQPLHIFLYLVAIGFGIAIHYSIMLNLAAVSFWIVRAQGLVYGYFNFLNIARYPDVIYPRLFRLIFSWVIPVVIVANIPARVLIFMAKSKKKTASHKAKKPAAHKPAKPAKKAVKRPSASKAKPKRSGLARPKAGRARTSNSPAEIFRDNHKPRRLDSFTKGQKEKLLQLRDAMVDSMAGVAQDTLRSRAEGSEASAFGMHQADAGSDAYDRDFALSLLSQEQDALYEIDQALK